MGIAISSLPLTDRCINIRLEGSTLHADVEVFQQYIGPPEGQPPKEYKHSSFPLDLVLGNIDGHFAWGYKAFSQTAENIRLDGTTLKAALKTKAGDLVEDSVDLNKYFYGTLEGVLQAQQVPVLLEIPKETEEAFLTQFAEHLEKNPDLKITAVDNKNGTTTFITHKQETAPAGAALGGALICTGSEKDDAKVGYANVSVNMTDDPDAVFISTEAKAIASVFHVAQSKGRQIEQVEVDILAASVSAGASGFTGGEGASVPTYIGADAKLSLLEAKASVFDISIAVGAQTDIGFKDESVGVHALGCGFTIGRKISISAFGSSFGIDIGRFFG